MHGPDGRAITRTTPNPWERLILSRLSPFAGTIFVKEAIGYERDSAQRRVVALKDAIYELALEEISEGLRTERLRALVKELHQLQAALKVNSTQPATREHHG